MNSLEQKIGKESKGNKLRAPYKDRQCRMALGGISETIIERPLHYKDPKESLFYKERMDSQENSEVGGRRGIEDEGKDTTEKEEEEGEHEMGRKIYMRGHEGDEISS